MYIIFIYIYYRNSTYTTNTVQRRAGFCGIDIDKDYGQEGTLHFHMRNAFTVYTYTN